jgi:hypothetical protein
MSDHSWFGDAPSVGELNSGDLAAYLTAVDDPELVAATPASGAREERWSFQLPVITEPRPFKHTGSMVGYIRVGNGDRHKIVDPSTVSPDQKLLGETIAIRLTGALVVRYPGRGVHEILLNFGVRRGNNPTPKHNFNATISAADGNHMPVSGQMLFTGIEVRDDGLAVEMSTVNVHSEGDKRLLGVLQSEVFQKGLDLVASTGPVVGLLSVTLDSLAKYIAGSSENRKVQTGFLGLDLDDTLPDTPKLRAGTYVLAQAPAEVNDRPWSWADYVYDQPRHVIVRESDDRLIEFNYVTLGIQPLSRE